MITIKGIKIDAINRTITEIELPTKPGKPSECCGTQVDCKDLYAALGCRNIEIFAIDKKNHCVVDGHALLKEPAPSMFWQWGDNCEPIANGGIITGHDLWTDTWSDTTIPLHVAYQKVRFTRRIVRGMKVETDTPDGYNFKATLVAPLVDER